LAKDEAAFVGGRSLDIVNIVWSVDCGLWIVVVSGAQLMMLRWVAWFKIY